MFRIVMFRIVLFRIAAVALFCFAGTEVHLALADFDWPRLAISEAGASVYSGPITRAIAAESAQRHIEGVVYLNSGILAIALAFLLEAAATMLSGSRDVHDFLAHVPAVLTSDLSRTPSRT